MFARITKLIAVALFAGVCALSTTKASAQCSVVSSTGYTVNIDVQQVSTVLSTTTDCSNNNGYGYQISYNYGVSFTGNNIPSNVYTLQGTFNCTSSTSFFAISTTPGNGSGLSSNSHSSKSDCATANASTLGCNQPFTLVIEGLGIARQTLPCALRTAAGLPAAPLPVKLISFDAAINNNKVDLSWTTATETDNAYFILEKSADAKSWADLTRIDGAGTTRYNTTYNYADEMPQSGMSYYRLKQVDANGAVTYSKVLAVKSENTESAISLYPNPTNGGQLHITGLQTAADWSVKVINTSSAVVYQSASMTEELALPSMPAGLYFVQLQNSKTGKAQMLKLVKQ